MRKTPERKRMFRKLKQTYVRKEEEHWKLRCRKDKNQNKIEKRKMTIEFKGIKCIVKPTDLNLTSLNVQ